MTAIKKGFTLIELLIVIAILGVLAVVVLVAINPVQQLARTRDAGRISTVQQLGHAIEAYYVSHAATYPADWATLVTAGELTVLPGEVTNSLTTPCSGGDDATNGWCFASDDTADPPSFAVWSALEADTNLNIDPAACAGTEAYAAYLSAAGRGCIVCDAPPSATDDDSVCAN